MPQRELDYSVAQQPHMYPRVAQKSRFGDFLFYIDAIFILYYATLYTKFQLKIKTCKKPKITYNIVWNFLIFGHFLPYFFLYHALPNTNLHTKFQKNPFMFPEFIPNTKLLRFHAS
jgi:hypothetical protein